MAFVRRRRRGPPEEYANSEATDVGVTHGAVVVPHYDTVNDDAVTLTGNITTTRRCLIIVVTCLQTYEAAQVSQIQRGGVDRTVETTISNADFGFAGCRVHLQYASEILDAGTYTYTLVNTSGGVLGFYGSAMKIVAVN